MSDKLLEEELSFAGWFEPGEDADDGSASVDALYNLDRLLMELRCFLESTLPRLCATSVHVGTPVPVTMEEAMGSKTDQIKGLANQAAGKLKQGVGKMTGSKETQAKGAAQEVKGKAQQTMGRAKSAVKDTVNKVADKANKKL